MVPHHSDFLVLLFISAGSDILPISMVSLHPLFPGSTTPFFFPRFHNIPFPFQLNNVFQGSSRLFFSGSAALIVVHGSPSFIFQGFPCTRRSLVLFFPWFPGSLGCTSATRLDTDPLLLDPFCFLNKILYKKVLSLKQKSVTLRESPLVLISSITRLCWNLARIKSVVLLAGAADSRRDAGAGPEKVTLSNAADRQRRPWSRAKLNAILPPRERYTLLHYLSNACSFSINQHYLRSHTGAGRDFRKRFWSRRKLLSSTG